VVLKQGVAVSDLNGALKEHVKQKIGPWKYPRWIGWWRACRRPRPERFGVSKLRA
jgi:acyl-coenzyme A synthetase/AMP-(fatty) acid ligase